MTSLLTHYRRVHQQGFIPIIVEDGRDHRLQVEACIGAGMQTIEYTLRCRDAREMIPWIRRSFPDITLLIGSTLDNDRIVEHQKKRHPQLMTIAELADLGANGFVSLTSWSEQMIARYCESHLIFPCSATHNEAYRMISAGAQMAKIVTEDYLSLIRWCRANPSHDYAPIFVTTGQAKRESILPTIQAGAICVGAGFDQTLKGIEEPMTAEKITQQMRRYLKAVHEARQQCYPDYISHPHADNQNWLDHLPHYHPFA